MSRRNNSDELAGQIGCFIIGLVIGLFYFLFKSTQTPPEDQLLKLQPSYAWRWSIEAIDCLQCGAVNASYTRHCFRCGALLVVPASLPTPVEHQLAAAPHNSSQDQMVGIIITVALVMGLLALALFASAR